MTVIGARDDSHARLVALAERLAAQTMSGNAQWSRTDQPERYLYAGMSGAVSIERTAPIVGGGNVMRIYDPSGEEVERLHARPDVITPELYQAIDILNRLYDAASRSAHRAEDVIEGLLHELGG